MRRVLALLLAVPLVALAGAVTAPAQAGDNHYVVVRSIQDNLDLFDRSSFDCAGEPAGGQPGLHLDVSPIHTRGQGSLLVRGAPDFQSGLMLRSPAKPRKLHWPVYPLTGDTPQGRWRVEMNDDVLTSDPIDLEVEAWNDPHLDEATLQDGNGWSGTIEDYIAQFGKGETWRVGFLTGGCLDSREVRVDTIGTRTPAYDFEARQWVGLTATTTSGRDGSLLEYGDPYVVTARASTYDIGSGTAHRVDGARVTFQRRWAGTRTWTPVVTKSTNHRGVATVMGTADRAAYWRAIWHRSGTPVPSEESYQGSATVLSLPRVDGARCRLQGTGYPQTCQTFRVDPGRVVLSGSARPGGSATLELQVHEGGIDGPVVATRTTRVDRHGHWQVGIATDGADRLTVDVFVQGTSPRHFASGGWQIPLRVR